MALVTLNDLPLTEDLDREAMQSLRGAVGEGNWVLGAFPVYAPMMPIAASTEVFNLFQQITNNNTYIGKMVNQTTTVNITNSGANSTNNAVLLSSLSNQGLAS
jgi:hypothetical protein